MPAPNVTVTANNQQVDTTLDVTGVPTGILQSGGQVFGLALTSTQAAGIPTSAQTAALTQTLVVGLVANNTSVATAQANAALIQAALNKTGSVFLGVAAGDYSINVASPSTASQILSIPSDTFLDATAGVNLLGPSTAASACLPLITNANWRSNKFSVTSITASTGSAPYVTTATARIPGHTFTVGKYVLFKGCTLGSRVYNNVWKVVSVGSPTANDLTFQMFGFSVAPANATGTVIAYPADSNIRIGPGLTFDANLNTNSTGTLGEVGKHCSIFNKIRELNVSARFRRAAKFGLHFCNAFDTVFDLGRFEQTSDGIHGLGPLQGCRITGVRGATGDDPCAFTGNNTGYTQYDLKDLDGTKNSDGDMTDVFIQAQQIATGGSRTILISAGANAAAKRFTVQSVQRATAAAGLYALLETPTGETGNYEDITFDGLFGDAPANNSLLFGASIAGTTTNIKNLVVRNIGSHGSDISGTPTAFSGNVISFGNGALNITGMTIDGVGVDCDLTNAAANVNLLVFGSGAGVHNIKGLSVSNVKMFSSGSTRNMQGVIIGSNGTYDRITLINVYGSGNGWSFVGDSSTQSGTGKLLLTNCTGDGNSIGGQAVIASAGGRSLDILLNNVTHENAANHMIYVYGGSSKTFDIRANNCKVSNKFFDFSAHASPTVRVRLSGCSSDNFTAVGGALVAGYGSGSPSWTFFGNCSDIGVDLSQIVRQSGTTIIATGTNGTIVNGNLAVCDATGVALSWKQVSNTTLSY
jgi:hypothetical protein